VRILELPNLARRAAVRVLRSFARGLDGLLNTNVSILGGRFSSPRRKSADFRSYLDGLLKSEWSAISVSKIAEAVMYHDFAIKFVANDETLEDKTAPVMRLFRTPNPDQTWPEFVELLTWYLLPLGNAFIWLRPSQGVNREPMQMWLLRPDRIEIVPDPVFRVKEYRLHNDDGSVTVYPREEILQIRLPNPVDSRWGLGKMEVAERVYRTDIAAAEYAWKYFENGADPGSVLQTEQKLKPEVREFLQEQWDQRHRGFNRSHNLAILEQGLTWQAGSSATPRESSFLETRKSLREAITTLFGLPPIKAGFLEGSTRATAFIQNRIWQRDTIAPYLKRLDAAFTKVTARFGPYYLQYEELIQEDNVEDAQIAQIYFGLGALSPNEVRTIYAGLTAVEGNPSMDVQYLPVSALPVGDTPPPINFSIDPSKPPATYTPEPEGPPAPALWPGTCDAPITHPTRPPRGTPVQRRVLRAYRQNQLHRRRVMRRQIAQFFRTQGDLIADRVLAGKAAPLLTRAKAALAYGDREASLEMIRKGLDDIFDPVQDEKLWASLSTRMFSEGLQEEFVTTSRLFKLDADEVTPFTPKTPGFQRSLNRLTTAGSKVTETTKLTLENILAEGVEQGFSPSVIANGTADGSFPGIRGEFEHMAQNRSQLIARTESARILDQANVEVYKDLGVTTCDVIGCEDNVIMPGEVVGCNSQNVPIRAAENAKFHPNHKGAIVPRITSRRSIAAVLTHRDEACYHERNGSRRNGKAPANIPGGPRS
jgi:HK97 family phage portal protein